MQHWSQLAIRNWRARPGRAAGTVVAIALGVGTVVWVTCSFESVSRDIKDQVVDRWVGRSHLSVESPLGHWGHIDQELTVVVQSIEGVTKVTSRLLRRMGIVINKERHEGTGASAAADTLRHEGSGVRERAHEEFLEEGRSIAVDAIGILPESEYAFRTYDVRGRLLTPGDRGVGVIEAKTARQLGLRIGDSVTLELYAGAPGMVLEIVGLFEARRVAKFQKPMVFMTLADLQQAASAVGQVTIIDAMLDDPSATHLERAAAALRGEIRRRGSGDQVTTATARLNQLAEAQRNTEFVLMLVSSVALLTAFFIILTTMNMGMVERIRQMGILRCVGMTRVQLAGLVVAEVAPLGALGLLLGVPVGIGLTYLGTLVAPDYVRELAFSRRGIAFAMIGGAATTLGGALLPALQAARVSALAAANPQAKPPRAYLPALAAVLGVILVAAHVWMVKAVPATTWLTPSVAIVGTATLYFGYALMSPLAVLVAGGFFVQLVARVIRVRPSLLNDHVGKAAWRGAGICCGLMVGLSLLISVVVHSASVQAGWDFPKRLAEAFVWTRNRVPGSYGDMVRGIPGIRECTVVNDFLCDVGEAKSGFFDMFKVKSTFVAGEPDVFLKMAKLEFLEGEYDDASRKLHSGGYVLLPPEASRAFGLHLGDKVTVTAANRSVEFEVAGVVQSPALDIAVTYFQADSYMMVAAAGSILGTLDDAKKHFGFDTVSLFLMNFDLPETPPPPMFESDTPPIVDDLLVTEALLNWGDRLTHDREEIDMLRPRLRRRLSNPDEPFVASLIRPYRDSLAYVAEHWNGATPRERWDVFRDQLLMRRVMSAIDRPGAIFGSMRQLKQSIDNDIREATLLLATVPVVALLVAALGVGNLMTANVISRSREIAVLRSSGATKGQIMRLVLGEAIVLGGIGSVAGLALGVHAAASMNELTLRMIGFAPRFQLPWLDIGWGVGLTMGVCILAGLTPARYAARSNIIDAMRTV